METLELHSLNDREAAIEALHLSTAIYTAEAVVQDLFDKVKWPDSNGRLVDPSCGDGVFLGHALERLLDHEPTISAQDLIDRVEGWEIHKGAVQHARARVLTTLIKRGRTIQRATQVAQTVVRHGDFLVSGPAEPHYDPIVGNPPYLRYLNVPPLLRGDYQEHVPPHAQQDLLHSFLDRCATTLKPDGEMALVTADRWLFNANAAKLRTAVGRRVALHHLERLDVGTSFYRPKLRKTGAPPRIHPVSVVLRRMPEGGTPLTSAPIFPDVSDETSPDPALRLDDVAKIRLAPWLGTLGVFVVDEDTARTFPPECLVPAIDTDDIKSGTLSTPSRFAICTRRSDLPDRRIMAHLERNIGKMAKRGLRSEIWIPPETWHRQSIDQAAFIVPRIARRLSAVRCPAGVLPINHNLSIVTAGTHCLEKIERLLKSEKADEWIRARAPRLEGGFFSITTNLLRQLPAFFEGE